MRRFGVPRPARAAFVVLLLLAGVRPAAAHGLGAECRLRGGLVELEAYFDDDTQAANARVQVQDQADRIIAEGRTDTKGRWSFPVPPPGRYRVVVDAGDGHRARVALTIPPGAAPVAQSSSAASQVEETAPREQVVTEGPTRADFTRTPWLRLSLGLGVIGLLALGWWGARQLLRRRPA